MTSAQQRPFIRGMRGYASILGSIWGHPATAQQLCGRFKITQRQLLHVLRQLHALGLVYVKGWRASRSHERNFSRVWGFNADGSREDAPPPIGASGRAQTSAKATATRPGIEGIAFHRLVDALRMPHTAPDLAQESGVSRASIYKFIAHARDAGLVRVADWEPNIDKHCFPMFQLGRLPDTPKPATIPNAERCRQYGRNRRAREGTIRIARALAGRPD